MKDSRALRVNYLAVARGGWVLSLVLAVGGCKGDGSSVDALEGGPSFGSMGDSGNMGGIPGTNQDFSQFQTKSGSPTTPSIDLEEKKNPVTQFTSAITNSSVAKSMGSAFKKASSKTSKAPTAKASTTTEIDPISVYNKTKPADAEFFSGVARLKERSGDTAAAAEFYNKALAVDPAHLPSQLGLARMHDRQGNLELAIKHYQQAVAKNPRSAAAHNDLGLCYARARQLEPSVEALGRAVELMPDKALYRNNISTVLVEMGRTDDALRHLSHVHGEAVAHYNVGYLLNQRGRSAEALSQFQLALQADPTLDAARGWVEQLGSAGGGTRYSMAGARVSRGRGGAIANDSREQGGFPAEEVPAGRPTYQSERSVDAYEGYEFQGRERTSSGTENEYKPSPYDGSSTEGDTDVGPLNQMDRAATAARPAINSNRSRY